MIYYTYKVKCNKCGIIEEIVFTKRKPRNETQVEFCYPCNMKTLHHVFDVEQKEMKEKNAHDLFYI